MALINGDFLVKYGWGKCKCVFFYENVSIMLYIILTLIYRVKGNKNKSVILAE